MNLTTDHQVIRDWAEQFGGKPQLLNAPDAGADKTGLRIDFPGEDDDTYLSESKPPKDVSWKRFFDEFEEQEMAFEFNKDAKESNASWHYRFIKREVADQE